MVLASFTETMCCSESQCKCIQKQQRAQQQVHVRPGISWLLSVMMLAQQAQSVPAATQTLATVCMKKSGLSSMSCTESDGRQLPPHAVPAHAERRGEAAHDPLITIDSSQKLCSRHLPWQLGSSLF